MGTALIAIVSTGSLASAAVIDFRATAEQAQETPPTGSTSVWTGTFQLDTTTAMVTYTVTQTGPALIAPEVAAHVHLAPIGVPGSIAFALPVGSPKNGLFGPLNAAQINDLQNGQYYVNIHSAAFPGGEVRGQILATQAVALPIDHLQCYKMKKEAVTFPPTVSLVDAFSSTVAEVKGAKMWCAPVNKNGEGVSNPDDHLMCYTIKAPKLDPSPHVQTTNQFGVQTLFVKSSSMLCVPGTLTLIP